MNVVRINTCTVEMFHSTAQQYLLEHREAGTCLFPINVKKEHTKITTKRHSPSSDLHETGGHWSQSPLRSTQSEPMMILF